MGKNILHELLKNISSELKQETEPGNKPGQHALSRIFQILPDQQLCDASLRIRTLRLSSGCLSERSVLVEGDDNLIVFPPKADDNSCVFVYSIHEHEKQDPSVETLFISTPAHCQIQIS